MRRALPATAAALILLATLVSGCSSGQGQPSANAAATRKDPLLGQSFYVEPYNPAAEQATEYRAAGQVADAALIERIATEPTAIWFTGSTNVGAEVEALTQRATLAHKSALLVAYDIPGRDCGSFSAGGAPSAAAYQRWIAAFASGIGERYATVVLEPDAIAQALTGCVSGSGAAERYRLLSYGVSVLKAQPHVSVYIDAGNLGWVRPPSRLVSPLRSSGIARADGFALNVSNFYTTAGTTSYGLALSRELGGAHFVIDTGRNGNGPEGVADNPLNWCNPPGRALGTAPTTETSSPLVDAYLWIKQPGASDGSCGPGEPRAGTWWPEYALALAQNTH